MCWVFETRHVNVAVYLTTPVKLNPPRVTRHELQEFLVRFHQRPRFASWEESHFKQLGDIAGKASQSLEVIHEGILGDAVLEKVLAELREFLTDYKLFAMPIGYDPDNIKFKRFLEYAGASSEEDALILIPDDRGIGFAVLDPLPQVQLLSEYPDKLPGVLFWSKTGAAALASLEEAYGLYDKLRQEFKHGADAVHATLSNYRPDKKSKCLLHLSDTHFGSEQARARRDDLLRQLGSQVSAFTRVVITGDLIDNPKGPYDPAFAEFKEFRRWLTRPVGA